MIQYYEYSWASFAASLWAVLFYLSLCSPGLRMAEEGRSSTMELLYRGASFSLSLCGWTVLVEKVAQSEHDYALAADYSEGIIAWIPFSQHLLYQRV
jgi:hypothetical protein